MPTSVSPGFNPVTATGAPAALGFAVSIITSESLVRTQASRSCAAASRAPNTVRTSPRTTAAVDGDAARRCICMVPGGKGGRILVWLQSDFTYTVCLRWGGREAEGGG